MAIGKVDVVALDLAQARVDMVQLLAQERVLGAQPLDLFRLAGHELLLLDLEDSIRRVTRSLFMSATIE
jgi:hypothetical protein